ncbi:MAG TPA: alpha/beta hydrolase [Anaerolineales bacterium]|jgi:pimeloyl-ACP methyl ester carboxylesterase
MMITIDTALNDFPQQEADELRRFRAAYPVKRAEIAGVPWDFIEAGRGPETLLILPGALGVAEMSFQQIRAFENEFRVIVPSYPFSVKTVGELLTGIRGLLAAENIEQVHVLGGSYGGMIAQRLVRRYPELVKNLILSHTGAPDPERVEKNKKFISLMRWLPMGLLRGLLRLVTRKSLEDAGEQRDFWMDYSNQITARLSRQDLISRYQVAVDFDATSSFSPDDLKDWPGRLLILEGDNDPIAEAPARAALKAFHPNAKVHTFHGSGHVASIAKPAEYTAVVTAFLEEKG